MILSTKVLNHKNKKKQQTNKKSPKAIYRIKLFPSLQYVVGIFLGLSIGRFEILHLNSITSKPCPFGFNIGSTIFVCFIFSY